MENDSQDLGYNGPEKEYKPQIGSFVPEPTNNYSFDDRTYRYETLVEQVDQIIQDTEIINSLAEKELNSYTLQINSEKLEKAQNAVWPKTVGDVQNYVTYNQYKALEPRLDRASKHIKDEYVANVRGEQGSGALDIKKTANVLNVEAKNIKRFLDAKTINNVNDSAQKRIAELFQDWSTSALSHSKRLLSFFSEGGKENTSKIPETEMASITAEEAGKYQALFKARINAVNLELDREMSDFERHFLTSSDIFYSKFLAPAIRFNNGAGAELSSKNNATTLLGQELLRANEAIAVNMTTALADLAQRNEIFERKMLNLESSIGRRESLKQVFKQFSGKSGNTKEIFINRIPNQQIDLGLTQALSSVSEQLSSLSGLSSSHDSLANRDDPDAHPQYVLKAGDTITGDIEVAPGVRIDGVDISSHSHTGLDGSQKISGTSIKPNSLPVSAVNIDEFVDKPIKLKLVGYSDGGKIGDTAVINANFFWESKDPDQMYEIQITKRDSTMFEE